MAYSDIKRQIDVLREQIAGHGKLTEEQKRKINYKFRLEWNYNSNSMEGNTLTKAETRGMMVGNLDIHHKSLKDVMEMHGHDEVITEILNIGKGDARLSERRIKEIHQAIIHESDEIKKEQIGKWKTENNEIINSRGEKYAFVDYLEVEEKMHDLLNRTNAAIDAIQANKKNAPHPIDVALDFHLEFLSIHPFFDGNGRTSRILTNLILISLGYTPFWINEKEREVYYNYISEIQSYGASKDLLNEYMAGLILRSEQLVINVIEGKDIEADDDLYKEIAIWKKGLKKNDELISYDIDVIARLYQTSLKPLFLLFLDKLSSSFDELFVKKSVTNEIKTYNSASSHYVDSKEVEFFTKAFEEVLKNDNTLEHYDKIIKDKLMTLRLNVYYSGFKSDGVNTFGQNVDLSIWFEHYQYYITYNREDPRVHNDATITKLYSEELSENEIKEIVKNGIELFFKTVQSSVKGK